MSKLSLLSKDFSKLREELIKRIPELTDKWTDYTESDIGITLIELMAGVGEMLGFYMDRNINECFLENARQRKNVISLAKSLGYEVKSSTTAMGKVSIKVKALSSIYEQVEFYLDRYTIFSTTGEKAIKFFSTEGKTIIPSDNFVEIPVVQGELGSQKEISTGEVDMVFEILESRPLRIKNIAFNYVVVYVSGEEWERQDTLIFSNSDDKHFIVEEDFEGKLYVKFGNNVYGKVPPQGAEIEIKYTKTDCYNVGINTIKILESAKIIKITRAKTPINGIYPIVSEEELTKFPDGYLVVITNSKPCLGGKKEETIEEIKKEAPLIFASAGRVVTKRDFEGWILKNPAVAQVVVWGEAEENPPNYDLFNIVRYCIVPVTYDDTDEDALGNLAEEIENDLSKRMILGVKLEHIKFNYVDISLNVNVSVNVKYSLEEVKNNIISKINEILNPINRTLGQDVLPNEFYKEIPNIDGVEDIVITSMQRSIPVKGGTAGIDLTTNVGAKALYKWELARPKENGIIVNTEYFYDKFSGVI